jgi:YegS/Rv2252/BmrU family lipid kinase
MAYAFIVNPNAGTRGAAAGEMIANEMSGRRLDYRIFFTERPGHGRELAREAVVAGFTTLVAVGGDGTIRETAEPLIGRERALGIIPCGSGNGLARNLHIPLDPAEALKGLLSWKTRRIDTGLADGKPFFCAAGVGLDARVARSFNAPGRARGIFPYVAHALSEFLSYKPETLVITTADRRMETAPLLAAAMNGRQYGGGALLAPGAYIDDGLLNLVTVRKAGFFATMSALPAFFAGRIDSRPDLVQSFTARALEIHCAPGTPYHLDGEDFESAGTIRISLLPASLSVLAP